jgi:hypothetical protein
MLGDAKSFEQMRALLRAGAMPFPADINLRDHELFTLMDINVLIKFTNDDVGVRKIGERSFELRLSRPVCVYFAGLLEPLATSEQAGHQYLDTHGHDDVVLMASKGEYGSDIFHK